MGNTFQCWYVVSVSYSIKSLWKWPASLKEFSLQSDLISHKLKLYKNCKSRSKHQHSKLCFCWKVLWMFQSIILMGKNRRLKETHQPSDRDIKTTWINRGDTDLVDQDLAFLTTLNMFILASSNVSKMWHKHTV